MGVQRNAGESKLDYHKRLIYEKVLDKTLHDVDYSELSELVYDQPYNSDVARRMMYGSAKTLQLMDECARSGDGNLSEADMLEVQRIELQKERQRLQDQRREYRKLANKDGRIEHIEDRLVAAANELGETVGFLYDEDVRPGFVVNDDSEAVLVLADFHYGMKTDNIWNKFNKEICVQRVKKVVAAAAVRICAHDCRRLHVVLLGDMVNGGIHTNARVQADELVADQIMQVSEILAQSIYELSQTVDEVFVYSTYGNHARVISKKDESVHRDNFERIIPAWMRIRLQNNPNIHIVDESENEFIHFYVHDYAFCATHGDLDQPKKAGSLFPTLFQQRFGKKVDYILLGHTHHRQETEELGVETMVCGSLCGSDDYANEHRLYSRPEQLLLIVDPDCGVDATYHLKL